MSGPVGTADAAPGDAEGSRPAPPTVEVTEGRATEVGGVPVRRTLPRRRRRTVGAWCFVDHMGPVPAEAGAGMRIGPHPHIGLQTVTWLLAGEVVHTDSLGTEQAIRPGQLNLMTAGRGVSHAEETRRPASGSLHGAQLWVALPDATRHGDPAFEHHADLPVAGWGRVAATVLVGRLGDAMSAGRADTPIVGADLDVAGGGGTVPLDPAFEHAVVPLTGTVAVDGEPVAPGHLAYLGTGREAVAVDADAPVRALLLGGAPFPEPVLMWWNFVGRTRDDVDAAWADWEVGADRFGEVPTGLPRIPAPRPSWLGAG